MSKSVGRSVGRSVSQSVSQPASQAVRQAVSQSVSPDNFKRMTLKDQTKSALHKTIFSYIVKIKLNH